MMTGPRQLSALRTPPRPPRTAATESTARTTAPHAVRQPPLLHGRGVGPAEHDHEAHAAKERGKVEERADLATAVDGVDIAASRDLFTRTVSREREVGVGVDDRRDEHDRPEEATVGCLVLHDLLHGGEARPDVEGDARAAEGNDLDDAVFGKHLSRLHSVIAQTASEVVFDAIIVREADEHVLPLA